MDSPADGDCTDDPGDERLYYTTDANMNVTALVNTSGTVVERYVYDPYGKVTIYDPNWGDTKSWDDSKKNEILYCGYDIPGDAILFSLGKMGTRPILLCAWCGAARSKSVLHGRCGGPCSESNLHWLRATSGTRPEG